MNQIRPLRIVLFSAALVLVAACGGKETPATPPAGRVGFVDGTETSGITWRMSFLPEEQGENFKVNLYDHGAGVAVADIDGDGRDDIYFVNQLGGNALYRNLGGGKFEDITGRAGPLALDDRICVSAAFGDIENDGDQDLFVISTRGGNALFRNEGGGRFTDVTKSAGVELVAHSQGATFFDADLDGDLDLFVANTGRWTSDTMDPRRRYYPGPNFLFDFIGSPIELNSFYRNRGDGTFEQVAYEVGLEGTGWSGDCTVFDYDEDGDPDLFVASMFGWSHLYRNDGKGRFEDVTAAVLGRYPWGAMGTRAFDFDGDAHLDLFVVDMHSDMWMDDSYAKENIEPARKYPTLLGRLADVPGFDRADEQRYAEKMRVDYTKVILGNGLYRWMPGEQKFEEISDAAGAETFWPWGVMEGDFDNDGYEDAFLAGGMGYPFFYWPSAMLVNRGNATFADRTEEWGIEPPAGGRLMPGRIGGKAATRSARSAAVSDFDGDGRLDLIVNNFNDKPSLLLNRLPTRHFVSFRLTGTRSNRDAIGATLRLHVGGRVLLRQVQAAGGYLAQSTKTVHFGLGDLDSVDKCEIRWPGGDVQWIEKPAVDRLHEITQP